MSLTYADDICGPRIFQKETVVMRPIYTASFLILLLKIEARTPDL